MTLWMMFGLYIDHALMMYWFLISYLIFSGQYGGWWTSVRGWDGWAWLSTCCSASWLCTTSLKCTHSVWSVCREVESAHRLRPLPSHGLTCHRFLSGCGYRSSCCHTYSSSFSCSLVRELTPEPLVTVYFLFASPCCAAVATLHTHWPITGKGQWSTHRTNHRLQLLWNVCLDVCDVTSCVP